MGQGRAPDGFDGAEGGEVAFGDDEVFFSRTDPAGIIQDGNSVFQRVSGYAWAELAGKPHKIIRHPGTPRAVFRLLWREIKAGRPIGAYVRNQAKSGDYYWVFATVTPIEGGYLSVRIKPGGELFGAVRDLYREGAALEREAGLDPDESLAWLGERLAALGFRDYRHFMAAALQSELADRDRRLGRAGDEITSAMQALRAAADLLVRHAEAIAEQYDRNAFMPQNFQILAAHLGQSGAAMGAVSSNYLIIAEELNRCVERFGRSAREVHATIHEGVFLAAVARVQREMADFFRAEGGAGGVADARRAENIALLDRQRSDYGERAGRGLEAIARAAEGFRHDCAAMTRLSAGLEITRLIAKVENARLPAADTALNGLIDELGAFQQAVAAELRRIELQNGQISAGSATLARRLA
jgi:PAS domain S-box-containing protein